MSQHIDLSSHTHLRTINFIQCVSTPHWLTASSWIPTILSQLPGCCIEGLKFQFVVADMEVLQTMNWDVLADILIQSSFPQLQDLRIILEERGSRYIPQQRIYHPKVVKLVRRKLSTWDALGVLSF